MSPRNPDLTRIPSAAEIAEGIDAAWKLGFYRPPATRKPPPVVWAMTLAEVGDVLGLSAERVRQIEASALKKCRRWAEQRGLDLTDLITR